MHADGTRSPGDGSVSTSAPPRPREREAPDARPDTVDLDRVQRLSGAMTQAIGTVIEGKPEAIHLTLIALFSGGHLLIEDVPGVGKTMLAKSLARAIDADVSRVQFTPDLLPSDITGVSVFNQDSRRFEFRPGAIFASVVVGDEINRASPKTQSAMLECLEEQQVTVDGTTYRLPSPFLVMATQNPIEMEGTYPLPEAQRDRFMARISLGYPPANAELAMLQTHGRINPLDSLTPVTDAATVAAVVADIRRLHVARAINEYVVALITETRRHRALRLGASPRASLHLLRASRTRAALAGRDHVLPQDVQQVATDVLTHRVLLTGEAQLARTGASAVIEDVLSRTPVPSGRR